MVGETATVVRRGGVTTRFGDPLPGSEHDIVGFFAPTGGFEQMAGRDTVTTQPTFYTRTVVDVLPTDHLRIRGVVYSVDGQPAEWRSPVTGGTFGVAIPLKGVTG